MLCVSWWQHHDTIRSVTVTPHHSWSSYSIFLTHSTYIYKAQRVFFCSNTMSVSNKVFNHEHQYHQLLLQSYQSQQWIKINQKITLLRSLIDSIIFQWRVPVIHYRGVMTLLLLIVVSSSIRKGSFIIINSTYIVTLLPSPLKLQ